MGPNLPKLTIGRTGFGLDWLSNEFAVSHVISYTHASMPSIGHDTKYLQELVGDALARGCASTIAAQPNDPVDFLGQWLLRCDLI